MRACRSARNQQASTKGASPGSEADRVYWQSPGMVQRWPAACPLLSLDACPVPQEWPVKQRRLSSHANGRAFPEGNDGGVHALSRALTCACMFGGSRALRREHGMQKGMCSAKSWSIPDECERPHGRAARARKCWITAQLLSRTTQSAVAGGLGLPGALRHTVSCSKTRQHVWQPCSKRDVLLSALGAVERGSGRRQKVQSANGALTCCRAPRSGPGIGQATLSSSR